jgi:hypothetical protein
MSGCYTSNDCKKQTKKFLIKLNDLLRKYNMRLVEDNIITSTEYGYVGRIEDDLTNLTLIDDYQNVIMETEDD